MVWSGRSVSAHLKHKAIQSNTLVWVIVHTVQWEQTNGGLTKAFFSVAEDVPRNGGSSECVVHGGLLPLSLRYLLRQSLTRASLHWD